MNSVVTVISDYGPGSPYTAALVGTAMRLIPEVKVIEISNQIKAFDVAQAAFLLNSVYRQFPEGTVHLICVDTSIALHRQLLFAGYAGHYFVAADNGAFSLLFDGDPDILYQIPNPDSDLEELFPEKNVFLPFLARWIKTGSLEGLTQPAQIRNQIQGLHALVTENSLSGTVMLVDSYQNAITNIHRDLFVKTGAGRPFQAFYARRRYIDHISRHFASGEGGDEMLLFNENGFLMVTMNHGKGAQLLGLKPGSRVVIEFEPHPETAV